MLDEKQLEIVNSTEPRIIVEAGGGSGKALPNSTLIPTTDGIKKVSDIKVGDFLYDKNGNPTKVLGVYPQGKKEVYKITFGDSREALCCNEHIWYVHKRTWEDKNRFKEYTVNEMLKEKIIRNNRAAQFYIPTSKAIEKEIIDYKIPPYIIGAFLANGCCMNHSRLTLSTENEDIPKLICSFIPNLKYKEGYNKYKWQFFFDEPYLQNFLETKIFLKEFEKEICQYSYNKKIPEIYKNGSIKQRLELLQGLLDGDGSISKIGGTIRYTSTSLQLIKDIREVLWSLGYNSKLFEEKRTELYTNKCYYILINIPNCEKHKLFLLKRKKDIALKYKNIKQKKDFDRISIRSIEKMNYKEDMTCFYVDNKEHLFLMNDYIVTHNTRVLIERIKKLLIDGVPPENIVAISFTNMAAEEMKERLIDVPGIDDCFIGTIHSFANKIFKNSDEEYKLYTEEIQDQFMSVLITRFAKELKMDKYINYKELKKKVDLGIIEKHDLKNNFTEMEWHELKVFFGEQEDFDYPQNIEDLCEKHNVITFDELIRRTTAYFKEINGKIEYLFVDEFQDIGPLEKNFFQALNADNYFYIGDEKQCQPAGTLITMEDGTYKKIEDLKIEDRVLSYNLKEGHYSSLTRKGKGKRILDISEHIENELVEIEVENGLRSSYTKNHRCLAKIHYQGNEDKSVVYMMQNEKGQFRIGSTKLFTFNDRNFGLRVRMSTEKAMYGWILKVCDNQYDAWLEEQTCAYKYGIPQTTWAYKETISKEENIDKLYERLGDLTKKAQKCLEYFGKDINYPIFIRNANKHFSKLHITEVHACNLIPNIMDIAVPYKNGVERYKHDYSQIKEVKCLKLSTPEKVYGLKVEDTETYVADGILTHNSIYGFKGGNVNFFLNLIKNKKWKTYYLNNNYRCGEKIIDLANEVICQADDVLNLKSTCKSGKTGYVRIDTKYRIDNYLKDILQKGNYKDWFVLVRTNKDLVKLELKMKELGLPYISFRKGEMTLDQMRQCMAEDKVKLLTVHTSKGLESPNVLIWGNFPIRQKPYLRNNDEIKVLYVAITRAIDEVIILN